MGNITYEQFKAWCEHWNYTIEEGFRAMCFTANIVGQHYGNCHEYANKDHSAAFKPLAEKNRDDANVLLTLYNRLESQIFNVLENHESEG